MEDFKFKINEKVKYYELLGTIVDAQFHEQLGACYLIKYEDGSKLWAMESSLEKVVE